MDEGTTSLTKHVITTGEEQLQERKRRPKEARQNQRVRNIIKGKIPEKLEENITLPHKGTESSGKTQFGTWLEELEAEKIEVCGDEVQTHELTISELHDVLEGEWVKSDRWNPLADSSRKKHMKLLKPRCENGGKE